MSSFDDPAVQHLLTSGNSAVISTLNRDGSIHSAVVWVDVQDAAVAVNSAVGRVWPENLRRDPRATVLVYDESNPYEYVEIRGTVTATTRGADELIDRLAKKYLGLDSYPARQPGEQRITFLLAPHRVIHRT